MDNKATEKILTQKEFDEAMTDIFGEDLKKLEAEAKKVGIEDPKAPSGTDLEIAMTTLKAIGWVVAGSICFGIAVTAIEKLEKLGQLRLPEAPKAPAKKTVTKKAPVKKTAANKKPVVKKVEKEVKQ